MAAIGHGLKMGLNKAPRLLPVVKPIRRHHHMGKATAKQIICLIRDNMTISNQCTGKAKCGSKTTRPLAKAAAWQPIRNHHQSTMAGFGADPEKLEIAITSSILCKACPKNLWAAPLVKQRRQNPTKILKLGISF